MPPAYLPTGLTQAGLSLLLDAFDAANHAGCNRWELAVEIGELHSAGVNATGFRWLILKDYAEHAFELTLGLDERRTFRPAKTLRYYRRSCFILTPAGAAYARTFRFPGEVSGPESLALPATQPRPAAHPAKILNPRWDAELRQWWEGETSLKEFHGKKISDQELVLAAEEEEGWPPGMDNPLPAQGGVTSLERLRAAVAGLNRRQKTPRIHLTVDASTERVHWGPARRTQRRPAAGD